MEESHVFQFTVRIRKGEDMILHLLDDQRGVHSEDNCEIARREMEQCTHMNIKKVSLKVYYANIKGLCSNVLELVGKLVKG